MKRNIGPKRKTSEKAILIFRVQDVMEMVMAFDYKNDTFVIFKHLEIIKK